MKAQFVSENIKFERGKDPKDSMRIGKAQVKDLIRNEFLERAGSDLDRWAWDYQYKNIEGYDAYIIEIAIPDKGGRFYYALAPGLSMAKGSFPSPEGAMEDLKREMMKGSLGL